MQLIKVVISEDRMAAFILVAPGYDAAPQDIRDALAREGVVAGISPRAIMEAARSPRGMIHQVAWGTGSAEASGGSAKAKLVFNYAHSRGRPPDQYAVEPGFEAAWRRLEARGAVRAGDVVAYVRSPGELPKTLTVTGEETPLLDFGPDFRVAVNTKFSPDGLKIVATRSGIPYVDGQGAGVLDHVSVEGNVGSQTGNLSFPGDLTVRGNVEAGFSVSAWGDLLVGGHVWGSATARGRIVVSGGITAPGGVIDGARGITCRFCENSVIRSQGPIIVEETALHSVIETEDSVRVVGGRGRIAGGLVRAALGLVATVVGTRIGVPTVAELGASPRLRREIDRLERELAKASSDLAQSRRSAGVRSGALSDMDRVRLDRVRRHLEEQEKLLSESLNVLKKRLDTMPKGYFEAQRVLPGTRIIMGTDLHEFTSVADRISMGVRNA